MKSRSALVVSLHLDGFRRTNGRGLVASHCRPWGSLRFASTHPRCSPIARRAVRVNQDPPRSANFPSESVLIGSRYRVPAALCPLAVAPPCSLAGSARVRTTPCQGFRPLAQTSSPRGPRVHSEPPLAQPSFRASHLRRHSCRLGRPATASRLEWGCSGRLPGPPQPPSPFNLDACAPVRTASRPSRVLLPPKRLGSAVLRHQRRPARTKAKPWSSLPLARKSRPGSGAFSTSPAPCAVASSRSRLVLRDLLGLEALLRRRVPNPLRALRPDLDSLLPWVFCPLPRSSSPQPAPARAGASRRCEATASAACAA
jgi:hypothetical protein